MRDVFLMRLNSDGEPSWIKPFGGRGPDYASCIAVAGKDILIAGSAADSVWADKTAYPGTGPCLYLARWQMNGKADWVCRIGYTGTALIDALKITAAGNILAGGMFNGTLSMDGQPAQNYGGARAFLLELSPEGKVLQFMSSKGVGSHRLVSVDVDPEGNRYLLFHVTGTFEFENNRLPEAEKMEKGGIVLLKSGREGSTWMTSAEGSSYSEAVGVVAGKQGEVYACANFNGTLDASGKRLSTPARLAPAFLCFDRDGTQKWAVAAESGEMCRTMDGLISLNGNLLVAGLYQGKTTFGGASFLKSAPGGSLFLLQINPEGLDAWHDEPAAEGANFSKSIALDPTGNILLAGAYNGKVKLGGNLLSSTGEEDLLVAKYFNCGQMEMETVLTKPLCPGGTGIIQSTSGFESYLWNNSFWSGRSLEVKTPGLYTVAAFSKNGCVARDSIEVKAAEVPPLELGKDSTLCPGQQLTVNITGFPVCRWSNGVTGSSRTFSYIPGAAPEIFKLVAQTQEGCEASDSLKISYLPQPGVLGLTREWLSAYPNPVEEILWWTAQLTGKRDILVRLIDSRSVTLVEKTVKNYLPGSRESISMKGMAPGSYLLTLQAGSLLLNEKIVKK